MNNKSREYLKNLSEGTYKRYTNYSIVQIQMMLETVKPKENGKRN